MMNMYFKELAEDGFISFDGQSFGDSALEVAINIGKVINVPDAKIVQELTPSNKGSLEASSYSGNYGVLFTVIWRIGFVRQDICCFAAKYLQFQ